MNQLWTTYVLTRNPWLVSSMQLLMYLSYVQCKRQVECSNQCQYTKGITRGWLSLILLYHVLFLDAQSQQVGQSYPSAPTPLVRMGSWVHASKTLWLQDLSIRWSKYDFQEKKKSLIMDLHFSCVSSLVGNTHFFIYFMKSYYFYENWSHHLILLLLFKK